MKRVYITSVPLQGRGGLEKGIYQPFDFTFKVDIETSFPIITVLAQEQTKKEDVKVIALRTENNDTADNFEEMLGQLKQIGIVEEQVTSLLLPENQSSEAGVRNMLKIIEEIPDDSLVYADLTFGTKPMSIMILYAVTFIEKLKDAEVQGIYYGELPRSGGRSDWGRARLYDLTVYKYMSDMIDQLHGLNVSEPETALKELLDM